MKNFLTLLTLSTGTLLLITGCSKKEDSAPVQSTPVSTAPVTNETVAASTNAVVPPPAPSTPIATEVVKPAETNTAEVVPTPAPSPAAAATEATAQQILERAQALATEKRYPEALATLTELSKVNLTAEQQNWLNRLKTEISNAMASKVGQDTVKSVGDLFKK